MPSDAEKTLAEMPPALARARELILNYGWNSTSYQILNPGIKRWFARQGDAVVGYASASGVRIVVGAPVCARERLPEVTEEFESEAARRDERVCYLAAEARLEAVYKNTPDHAKVLLGAQPVWRPGDWPPLVARHKSLRAQLNRARNKGVTIAEWPREKAFRHPALTECLHRWLAAKGLPPLHFMVESETLARLFDRRVFVAERGDGVVGFTVLSPVATRRGVLFEQFVHCPGSPNGMVELMIDAAMRALAAENYEYATLGLSPLSTRARVAPFDNPFWLRLLLAWMRKHAQRFYNFDGLDAFKAKLQPAVWEPIFAIYNRPQFSPRTLYAIAAAFSENRPLRLIFGGLSKAFLTELAWLRRKIAKE